MTLSSSRSASRASYPSSRERPSFSFAHHATATRCYDRLVDFRVWDPEDATAAAEEDWKRDSNDGETVGEILFKDAIFELADVWCEMREEGMARKDGGGQHEGRRRREFRGGEGDGWEEERRENILWVACLGRSN